MSVCTPLQPDGDFVVDALGFVDCQARTIGAGGYHALAAPGSIVSLALTGLLTLFVAGYGFRLLTGETPTVRDGLLAFAKIAFVLTLATAWGPYRTLVYDVAMRGPAELAAAIGTPADLPGSGGALAPRLDLVDKALIQLAELGTGHRPPGQQDTRGRQVIGSDQVIVEPAQGDPNPLEPFTLGLARIVFLVGAVGAIGAVRLVAGLLLALGPLFVAFALFDSTRGLFEGWVRGLAAIFLGGIATTILLGTELALTEDWIADLLTRRLSNEPIVGAPTELLAVTLIFDLVLLAGLVAAGRVAAGFRLPDWRRPVMAGSIGTRDGLSEARARTTSATPPASDEHSRAWAIASGVAAMQRRELAHAGLASPDRAASAVGGSRTGFFPDTRTSTAASDRDAASPAAPTPLGHSFQRRPRSRISASAGRRDIRS